MTGPAHYEQHFPWYADPTDTTNIDCQCGHPCGGGVGEWADHLHAVTEQENNVPTLTNHRIESAVLVYLLWDAEEGRWVIDPVTLDGAMLDTSGTVNDTECECADVDTSHAAELARAQAAPLPTAGELIRLLHEAAGFKP